jgi:hypothetical protein
VEAKVGALSSQVADLAARLLEAVGISCPIFLGLKGIFWDLLWSFGEFHWILSGYQFFFCMYI